jgi:hypothetical protein
MIIANLSFLSNLYFDNKKGQSYLTFFCFCIGLMVTFSRAFCMQQAKLSHFGLRRASVMVLMMIATTSKNQCNVNQ